MWWAAPHTNTNREFLRRCVPAGQVPQHTSKSFGESEYMFQLTCRKQSMIQLNCRKQHRHRQGHFLWKLMMWCCNNHHIISTSTRSVPSILQTCCLTEHYRVIHIWLNLVKPLSPITMPLSCMLKYKYEIGDSTSFIQCTTLSSGTSW